MDIERDMEFWYKFTRDHQATHSRDTVCVVCLNKSLALAGWTHERGERAVKVNRYVGQGTGRGTGTGTGTP